MIAINLILTSVFSYFFIKLIIRYAIKLKVLDIPNERSHHCEIIPRAGGIGFIISFFLSMILFNFELFIQHWYIFLSIFVVFAIGVIDDRHEASAKIKFVVIFIAVFFLSFFDFYISKLGYWWDYEVILPIIFGVPLTMFALSGFTNALNLIDGIDGLAASISIVIISFFGFIGFHHGDSLMVIISITIIASLIGFLVLNWNPASIFMGDSGSLTLGFIISILAMLSLEYIHPITVLYFGAIPILDTFIVMTRRIKKGESPFSADKTHIHHILVKFFDGDTKKTVKFLVMMQIMFSATGYLIAEMCYHDAVGALPFFSLLGFILLYLILYLIFTGMKKRQKQLDVI